MNWNNRASLNAVPEQLVRATVQAALVPARDPRLHQLADISLSGIHSSGDCPEWPPVHLSPHFDHARAMGGSDLSIDTHLPRSGERHTFVRARCLLFWRPVQTVTVPGCRSNLVVKMAATASEWEQALALVADNYRARGYEGTKAELRFTPFHALPDTRVLVAKERDRVVATFSLVADNELLGLPLEKLYPEEVAQLRRYGRRLFETTCLAERGLDTGEFLQVFLALIRLAWQYGHWQGGDTNVIAVHPRHHRFYSRLLGYVPLGKRRSYEAVAGHPAEALFLDAAHMRRRAPLMHERILVNRLPPELLSCPPLPAALLRRLAARSTQTTLAQVDEILRHVRTFGSPRSW